MAAVTTDPATLAALAADHAAAMAEATRARHDRDAAWDRMRAAAARLVGIRMALREVTGREWNGEA